MEGALESRKNPQVSRLRVAAGIGVLVVLAALGLALLPAYMDNFEFQRHLEQISIDPRNVGLPPDVVRIKVLDRAARLGLPISAEQVRIEPAAGRTKLEVRYFIRVDLPMYTVDLHFRPSSGGR